MAAGLARQHLAAIAVPLQVVRVGTDCSGAEAPIWSMRSMQLSHRHIFSSDVGKAPQVMIAANHSPAVFFKDLLARRDDEVPAVDLYVAGFPCTPFSMLHHNSKLLKEKAAKVFFKILQYLRRPDGPPAVVLENVTGILRIKDRVLRLMRTAGYVVVLQQMDPTHLGEPVARPRVYFLMVKAAFAIGSEKALETVVQSVWSSLKAPMIPLTSRCLHMNHPEVQRTLRLRQAKFRKAQLLNFRGHKEKPVWPARHHAFVAAASARKHKSEGGLTVARSPVSKCSADALLLCNPRERSAWSILSSSTSAGSLTVDLSQSVDRASVRTDGAVPTITPGSILASAQLGRTVIPIEKLMLHAFPIHRMVFPKDVTDADLESLGGNTMHVMCVGVAIAMVLRMVDWAKVRRSGGRTGPDLLQPVAASRPGSKTAARAAATSSGRIQQASKRGLFAQGMQTIQLKAKKSRHD